MITTTIIIIIILIIPSFSVLLNVFIATHGFFSSSQFSPPFHCQGQGVSGCVEFSCPGDIAVNFHVCVEQSVHPWVQKWMYLVLFLQASRIRGARMLGSRIWSSTFTFSSFQLRVVVERYSCHILPRYNSGYIIAIMRSFWCVFQGSHQMFYGSQSLLLMHLDTGVCLGVC